jgi:hypothetical protein
MSGWTVLLKADEPHGWQRLTELVVQANAGILRGDASTALRRGQGFVDLVMTEETARAVEQALLGSNVTARALRWAECEEAALPQRITTLSLTGPELVPGLPFGRVEFVHLVHARPAPFFVAPQVTEHEQTLHEVAVQAERLVSLTGVDDAGATKAFRQLTELGHAPVAPTTSAPELVLELFGLWTPRLHAPVEQLDFRALGITGGRRARLALLLTRLLERCPTAKRLGHVDRALERLPLDGLAPLAALEHKRLVAALLTSRRLWPPSAR